MSNTYFQKIRMKSEFNNSMLVTGEYQVAGVDTAVTQGAFVELTGLANNTTYATSGVKDINKYTCSAPTAVTDKGVYVVDFVKVQDGVINGNTYRIGVQDINLTASAGTPVRLREIGFADEFILGDGNFASAPTVGQYAILTAASIGLTPNATVPTSGLTVRIEQQVSITQGTTANVTGYVCTVVQI